MKPQLPPRESYWIQDGDNLRPPTDEEFVEYLKNIILIEGLVIVDEESSTDSDTLPIVE
jgi:hypothetical protein